MEQENSTICVFTDGGSRGNPGHAALGVSIENKAGEILDQFGTYIGITTNNVAEYKAVSAAFDWLIENKNKNFKTVLFFLDSELVVRQLNGIYKIKNETLQKLLFEIQAKQKKLTCEITFAHVRREKNKQADKQVNIALDKYLGVSYNKEK